MRRLRDELPQLLLENLDFTRVARLQRIFRREAKRSKLDYLTAARIYARLTRDDVIVSELVSGVWLDEVIAARPSAQGAYRVESVVIGGRGLALRLGLGSRRSADREGLLVRWDDVLRFEDEQLIVSRRDV